MKEEIPQLIYAEEDIEKAFDMGLQTGLAVFGSSLGLSYESQKLILDKMKDSLIEDRAAVVMNRLH